MTRKSRLTVCRFMLIAMLAVQGLLAWHDSAHALENHGAAAHNVHHHRQQTGAVCDLCTFAQDFAKVVMWQGPVLQPVVMRPYFEASPGAVRLDLTPFYFYTARAPPAS